MSSKDFIEGFIEIYRSHECLWKLTSPEYTNKNIKNSAYKELVEYCKKNYDKADNDFVKQKIQNLRTAFRKELKKVQDSKKSGTGTDDIYFPKLWYYDLLLFTVDDVLPQPSLDSRTNNEFEEENSIEEIFDEDTSSESNKRMKINESNSEAPTSAVSQPGIAHKSKDFKFPSTSHQSARNKSNKSLRKKEDDFLATCSDAITEISKNKNNDVDEFDALAITWVAKLRKLKEKQMVLAEGLISEVLKKAYFEELTRATVIKDDMVIEIATSSCHSWPSRSTELVSPRSPELVSPRSTENTQYNENNIPQDGQQSNTLMYYSQFSDQLLEL